jgi:hypothetical protein
MYLVRTNYLFSKLFWFVKKKDLIFYKKQLGSTKMKSLKSGKNISRPEIANISEHGFWILLDKKEYFLPFAKYMHRKFNNCKKDLNFLILK